MDLRKFIGRPKDEFERAVYKLKYEVGASFYDSNGTCIGVAVGNKDTVVMSPVLGNIAYGTTHNHIDDSLFSRKDIERVCRTKVREMRVTTPSGKCYSMRKCDDFSPQLFEVFSNEWELQKERVSGNIEIFAELGKVGLDYSYVLNMKREAYNNFVRNSLSWFSEKYRFIFTEGDLV